MKKRGQITAIMIALLVLAISVSLAYYFYYTQVRTGSEVGVDITSSAGETITIGNTYVQNCLDNALVDIVSKLGERGGYVSLDDNELGISFDLDSMKPTESEAVAFTTGGDYFIPYWWFMRKPNDCLACTMDSKAPSKTLVIEQIDKYVKQEFLDCLQDFKAIKDMGYEVETDLDPQLVVEFGAEDTLVKLSMPFSLKKQDVEKVDFDRFESRYNVPLSKFFTIASTITEFEKTVMAFDKILINIISLYGKPKYDAIPPMAYSDNEPLYVTWSKTLVERQVREVMMSTIPFISINGSANEFVIPSSDPYSAGVYNTFVWDIFDPDYDISAYEIYFHYLGWPFHFDITPRNGDTIKPDTVINTFFMNVRPPTYYNRYNFFYDLSVPVVVEIRNNKVANKKGYSFFFALEANIRDNMDMYRFNDGTGSYGSMDYSNVNVTLDYIISNGTRMVSTSNTQSSRKLFCNTNQRLSANVTVNVIDGYTGQPLNNTLLQYSCGDHAICPQGYAHYDRTTMKSSYEAKFPVCLGGALYASAPGYETAVTNLDTNFEDEKTVEIGLYEKRNVSVDFKVYQATDSNILSGMGGTLNTDEMAIISLQKIRNASNFFEDHVSYKLIAFGNGTTGLDNIDLVPGKYTVSGQILDMAGYTIQAHCKRYCSSYDSDGDCESYSTTPDQNIDISPAPMGGIDINSTDPLIILPQDLRFANNLEIRLVRVRQSTCVDEANMTSTDSCQAPGGICIGMSELTRWMQLNSDNYVELMPRLG
ncbi:hypothetical protein K9M79_00225 [Candidatus Woesearchaeota archaeon]|nr:hypothetical protein [Candidatus Woesearchaeota archaeon]